MKRIKTLIRGQDEASVQTDSFASQSGYWTEGEAYEISARQASAIKTAALTLVGLFNDAMDAVTADKKYADHFVFTGNKKDDRGIYKFAADQWQRKKSETYILDRWDIAWDGIAPPKLLERNFGYIGLIAGTASVQENYIHWLSKQEGYAGVAPFGNLQSSFVRAFRQAADECAIPAYSRIAVTTEAATPSADKGMIRAGEIICRWIKRAGYDPVKIDIEALRYAGGRAEAVINLPKDLADRWQHEITYKGHKGQLLDTFATMRITQDYCFPFACSGDYAQARASYGSTPPKQQRSLTDFLDADSGEDNETIMLYPYWSLLMGHKALLPIMYERNPGHANLLPSFFDSQPLAGLKYVVKRANGCQGIGSKIVSETGEVLANRQFKKGREKFPYHNIYQQYAASCEDPSGGFRVFHLFTAAGQPAALGARAAPAPFVGGDDTQTKFVPVLVRDSKRSLHKPKEPGV